MWKFFTSNSELLKIRGIWTSSSKNADQEPFTAKKKETSVRKQKSSNFERKNNWAACSSEFSSLSHLDFFFILYLQAHSERFYFYKFLYSFQSPFVEVIHKNNFSYKLLKGLYFAVGDKKGTAFHYDLSLRTAALGSFERQTLHSFLL